MTTFRGLSPIFIIFTKVIYTLNVIEKFVKVAYIELKQSLLLEF